MPQKQKNFLQELMVSRSFWISLAATASTGLIFYEWYSDRYASPATRYSRIEQDYVTPMKQLYKIRTEFIKEMKLGLSESDEVSSDPKRRKSSLKMLASNIHNIPNGSEKGTYYALDWGGSTFRVLRITFQGRNHESKTVQLQEKLKKQLMTVNDEKKLFDHLAGKLRELMEHVHDIPESKTDDNVDSDQDYDDNDNDNGNEEIETKVTNKDGTDSKTLKEKNDQYKRPLKRHPSPLSFPQKMVQGYATIANNKMEKENEKSKSIIEESIFDENCNVPLGFCFSFPMRQPAINEGILVEWTKGFSVPNCVGRNVAALMVDGLKRKRLENCTIKSVVNDTVGTLLACAYDNDHTRIGLILGTGTNAAYIEPSRNNEIINIEWGNYNKHLPRVPPDWIMDEDTPNTGVYFAEKMVSGYYLGELSRLLAIEVFREKITDYGDATPLNIKWKFGAEKVSQCLEWYFMGEHDKTLQFLKNEYNLKTTDKHEWTIDDAEIFGKICKLIVYRSADVATSLLCAVLEKTGLYHTERQDERNPFEKDVFILNEKYQNDENKYVTVGIDGSVYQFCAGYSQRVRVTLEKMLGTQIANKVVMVHSEDGSGKGAALAAAGTQ